MSGAFEVHHDARGSLLPVEFGDLDFTVRRLFVVTGVPGGADRGDHLVPCRQEVVLVSGTAVFTTTSGSGGAQTTVLAEPGARLGLRPGDHVHYRLEDESSQVVVLAEDPWRPHPESP